MVNHTKGRREPCGEAKKAAEVVLAKHPNVIPSSSPPVQEKASGPEPAEIGAQNIGRALSK